MRAITVRWGTSTFTGAQPGITVFLDLEYHRWGGSLSLVRAIAERLFAAKTAGTPRITFIGLQIDLYRIVAFIAHCQKWIVLGLR